MPADSNPPIPFVFVRTPTPEKRPRTFRFKKLDALLPEQKQKSSDFSGVYCFERPDLESAASFGSAQEADVSRTDYWMLVSPSISFVSLLGSEAYSFDRDKFTEALKGLTEDPLIKHLLFKLLSQKFIKGVWYTEATSGEYKRLRIPNYTSDKHPDGNEIFMIPGYVEYGYQLKATGKYVFISEVAKFYCANLKGRYHQPIKKGDFPEFVVVTQYKMQRLGGLEVEISLLFEHVVLYGLGHLSLFYLTHHPHLFGQYTPELSTSPYGLLGSMAEKGIPLGARQAKEGIAAFSVDSYARCCSLHAVTEQQVVSGQVKYLLSLRKTLARKGCEQFIAVASSPVLPLLSLIVALLGEVVETQAENFRTEAASELRSLSFIGATHDRFFRFKRVFDADLDPSVGFSRVNALLDYLDMNISKGGPFHKTFSKLPIAEHKPLLSCLAGDPGVAQHFGLRSEAPPASDAAWEDFRAAIIAELAPLRYGAILEKDHPFLLSETLRLDFISRVSTMRHE